MTKYTNLDVEQARKIIENEISNFLKLMMIGAFRYHAMLKCDTGLGKSTATLKALADAAIVAPLIQARKAASKPHKVFYAVPHHKLSQEVADRFQALGVSAVVFRGREAINPATGASMCLNYEAVQEVQSFKGDVKKMVCGPSDPTKGPQCPFRNNCAYLAQKKDVDKADVVIASHQLLFSPGSLGDISKYALVVIDETFYSSGLYKTVYKLDADSMITNANRFPIQSHIDGAATQQKLLISEIREFQKYIDVLDDGEYITRAIAKYMDHIDFETLRTLEWDRKVVPNVVPGMTPSQINAAASNTFVNSQIPKLSAMWRILDSMLDEDNHDNLDARLSVHHTSKDNGKKDTFIHMNLLRKISKDILNLPILYLDATPTFSIAQSFIPDLYELADVSASAPNMHIKQIRGVFGKRGMMPYSGDKPQEAKRKQNRINDFKTILASLPGSKLVITYEKYEPNFQGLPDVVTAHFNATTGLNSFETVDHILIIGRPFARSEAVKTQAESFFGKIIADEKPIDHKTSVLINGVPTEFKVKDYVAQELRDNKFAITDSEIIQNIGRGRGVNRTALTPLNVLVFSDVIIPHEVEAVIDFADLLPKPKNRIELMAQENAFLDSPEDMHAMYPHIFESVDVAKKDKICPEWANKVRDYYNNTIVVPHSVTSFGTNLLLHVTSLNYQYTGAREKVRVALVHDVAKFKIDIEKINALALFEVTNMTDQEKHIAAIKEFDIQSDGEFHLTKFSWKYGKNNILIPGIDQLPRTRLAAGTGEFSWDELNDLLEAEHAEVIQQKGKRHLWSSAFYGSGATRSLANAHGANVLICDFDDGVATPDMLMQILPVRMICTNTYTSTSAKLKWRAYIPMHHYVNPETYRYIMEEINRMIAPAQMDDASFSVAQAFYAPCQPAVDTHLAFYKVCLEPILDPIHFIKQIATVQKPVQSQPATPTNTAPHVNQPFSLQIQIQRWIDDCQNASPRNHFKARKTFAGKVNILVNSGEIERRDAIDLFDDMAKHFAVYGDEGHAKYLSDMMWVL